ncbi:hypothetical protein F4815DRAFT_375957 [Daldinia loculata]|nr:hypothetical protein F4815DRAFT_375957 [Daldinia loculata]
MSLFVGVSKQPQQEISRSQCSMDDVKKALEQGLDPNVQWKELEIDRPRPTGGCVFTSFDRHCSWANYNTPLHKSLWYRHYNAAALSLESGARINLYNALGKTPLHEALLHEAMPHGTPN